MSLPDKNASPAGDACPCPTDGGTATPPRGFLSRVFKKCAACAGSGAAGFLVGHAGCVITPLVIAAAGITTATAGMSAIALAFGAAATAGGLYAWHKLRGAHATPFEKRLVIGSAVSGLLVSAAMMQFNGHDHHGGDHAPHHNHGAPTEQTDPHHGHHGHGAAATPVNPAAQAWFNRLDTARQKDIESHAKMLNQPLGDYLNSLCITPVPAPARVTTATP